jgi:hypothetical protein
VVAQRFIGSTTLIGLLVVWLVCCVAVLAGLVPLRTMSRAASQE